MKIGPDHISCSWMQLTAGHDPNSRHVSINCICWRFAKSWKMLRSAEWWLQLLQRSGRTKLNYFYKVANSIWRIRTVFALLCRVRGCLAGGVSVHVWEARCGQAAQAEATRDCDGHTTARRHHAVAYASSPHPACSSLPGGMWVSTFPCSSQAFHAAAEP